MSRPTTVPLDYRNPLRLVLWASAAHGGRFGGSRYLYAARSSQQSDVLPAAELHAQNAVARQKRGSQFPVVWFAPSERIAIAREARPQLMILRQMRD